jgi:IS605 OrfB family transposase
MPILETVKLVANIQLRPTAEQAKLLRTTLERANEAANWLSRRGFEAKVLRQYDLHKLAYRDLRERFGIGADFAIRVIAKVADAYLVDRRVQRRFRWDAAQPYNDRLVRFTAESAVSIWTVGGRQKIPFVCGQRQRALLAHRKGELDLMRVRGKWYLACVCDIPEPPLHDSIDVLGVDLGIVNLACDSDGTSYSGKTVERLRRRYGHRRKNLQKKRTRSARRRLRLISGREARFRADMNHQISKSLVQTAERTSRALSLEELGGIRERVTARRRQRARLHGWAFAQLRSFVEYKAKREGVPIVLVDPRNTSRECPECGTIDKRNRRSQSEFQCVSCGYSAVADHVAARNIRARAVVNLPMVARCA